MTQARYVTLSFRLKDKHEAILDRQAKAVNLVWNYVNETQKKAATSGRRWLNKFDLQKLTAGSSRLVGLHAHTIQRVCHTYDNSRRQRSAPWLRWRGRKSLGWVPFNNGHVRFDGEAFVFNGQRYWPMHMSKSIYPGMRFAAGNFSSDSKGHWYINLPIEMDLRSPDYSGAIGIDLGLKTLATLSSGTKIVMPSFYRQSETALACAQRARKSARARAIHAKARARRKDFLHKSTTELVNNYGTIAIGTLRPSRLAKTKMAKSVYDAAW